MSRFYNNLNNWILGVLCFFSSTPAFAGKPYEWQLGLQEAASTTMSKIHSFHDMLLYIIFSIAIFVLLLLIYVVIRFNAKANPVPSKTTHNWTLEIAWISIPTLIVLFISIYSMRLLYYQDRQIDPDMTIKVIGYQWYWGYEYPDHGDIAFNAYMIQDSEIDPSKGQIRLLSTDERVVLPINQNIQIQITAADVLHSWTIPAFGVKMDAVPGRLNETWVRITEPGIYYGQCSELCGKDHSYMPIEIHAVPLDEFNQWVVERGGTVKADMIEQDDEPQANELANLETVTENKNIEQN